MWARETIRSDVFADKPHLWFKIWFFLVTRVNFTDGKRYERGTCFTNYQEIMAWSRATYSEVDHCLRWLKSARMIATQKATRGLVVKVIKYEEYQTLEKYSGETDSDTPSELTARQRRDYSIRKKESEKDDVGFFIKNPSPSSTSSVTPPNSLNPSKPSENSKSLKRMKDILREYGVGEEG